MVVDRICISVLLLYSGLAWATGRTNCLAPDAWPKLTIKSVVTPKEKGEPFQLAFEIASVGKTPVAVSEEQFVVEIARWRWLFRGNMLFTNRTSRILTVRPEKPLTVGALVFLTEGEGEKKRSVELKPGKYNIHLFIFGDRVRRFDYQRLGQMSSPAYDFEVK